jgi:hypothetical protein
MAMALVFQPNGGTSSSSGGSSSVETEDLSSQLNGSRTTFSLSQSYTSGSLRIYYNGLRQAASSITETSSTEFSISFDAPSNEESLIVDFTPS